jgi:hypothetical protein
MVPPELHQLASDHVDLMCRSEGIGRSLAELVHPFGELTEYRGKDRFPEGRPGAHGYVGSVPLGPEASDFEFGAVEIGAGQNHHGPDTSADVEDHRSVAGACRFLGRP